MLAPASAPLQEATAAEMRAALERMRTAIERCGPPPYSRRREVLLRLRAELVRRADDLAGAIARDFGWRSRQETVLAEIFPVTSALRHTLRHLKGWMRERRVPVEVTLWPGRASVRPQPLGVVGIVSPWNYPLQLALVPLIAAVAAGNRVLLKPSEVTPHTASALENLLRAVFEEDEAAVVQGGPAAAQAFSRLPLDHLFFTGSTATGRAIMAAAAEHLTPVTLELGGKSPAIVAPDARLAAAAESIVYGKLLNAGQTCIAPDYVLVPEPLEAEFARLARLAAARLYPRYAENPDYTAIINERHWRRLMDSLEECRRDGATLLPLGEREEPPDAARRILPPILIRGAKPGSAVLREEIFGPLLPLVPYRALEEAIAYVNARPRPLALYLFTDRAASRGLVLTRVVAGGVTVNDTLLHFGVEALPFGGVGASGMGQYHGHYGFQTFSKLQPVFRQARFNLTGMIRPPYGRRFDALMRWMTGGLG
jgi:coniferyl-aldehyde dehydrogenase